uniref:RT_RNaseH domain-containing protein n=1 Tax=Caenorhabditis japonica TaxID=281687 RepID=A0A8R1E8X2_CAEJA
FEKLKTAVADNTMLSHFRDDWPIIVAADASAYGIGGVLLHTNPDGIEVPVAHVACSLTDTEQRYSQIEKEALALVYTVKKCHKFIFGRRFHLQTDHRPLLAIFGSSKDLPVHAQNRLVRWAMTLMAYDFEISYVATTKFAKADWLSRVMQEYPKNEDDVVIAEIDAKTMKSNGVTMQSLHQRVVGQGVIGSSPAAHDTSRSDCFGRVNRGNQKIECRSELNEHQSPNSRTFLERKEEVSSPCTQQLESEVQQDVSRVQPAPNLSQSLRRSQRNRRAPVRYDPCLELQSHSEDRAPKRGSAPYSDRAAARSRGLHIASNC